MVFLMTEFPSKDNFNTIKYSLKKFGIKNGGMKYVKVIIEPITLEQLVEESKVITDSLTPEDKEVWEKNSKLNRPQDIVFGKKREE